MILRNSDGTWKAARDSEGAAEGALTFEFVERFLKITNKQGFLVPLILNPAQTILAQFFALCWHLSLAVMILVPKGRQQGVSTVVEAIVTARCLIWTGRGRAYRVGLVAHDDDGVGTIFGSITRTFVKHLPPALRREKGGQRYAQPIGNSGEVKWEPGSSISAYSVKKIDALGKGGTLNALHYSEAANFADNGVTATKATGSINGAVAKDKDRIVVIESTANGQDGFFCEEVMRSIRGESEYVTIFIPWYLEPSYSMAWADYREAVLSNPRGRDPGPRFVPTEEELLLRAEVGRPVPEGEELTRWQHQLTDDQLIWRRYVIRNDYSGKSADFRRYYPSTLEEAFAATDRVAFAGNVIAEYASRTSAPTRGRVELEQPTKLAEWVGDEFGWLQRWEPPVPGEEYLLVSDVGEGDGSDFNAAYVFKKKSCRIVAAVHGQWPWEAYALMLEGLGYYYNVAQAVVEVNASPTSAAGAAVVRALRRAAYPRVFMWRDPEAVKGGVPAKAGWFTTHRNRPQLVEAIAEATRTGRLQSQDEGLVEEMKTFRWNEDKKRFEHAAGKNDDRVLAAAIGCFLLAPGGVAPEVDDEDEEEEDTALARWRRRQRSARERSEVEEPKGITFLGAV